MKVQRPVGGEFHISNPYGAWERFSNFYLANGMWVHGQLNGQGQHKGTDFACPEGTIVYAMMDGLAMVCGFENPSNTHQGFGLRVRQQIVTESGIAMTLVYGHLSRIDLRPGQQIVKGDKIGLSGNSGHTSGPHLHVELVDGRNQYHPLEFETPTPQPIVAPAAPAAAPESPLPSEAPPENV